MQDKKLKVLFLCTGNSCRSQMAEGWARQFHNGEIEAYSAGNKAEGLNPRAVKVMAEAGVDISEQQSELVENYLDADIDIVITVCGQAHDTCPMFSNGALVLHEGFDDPPYLTQGIKDEESILAVYRRVRDEISNYIVQLPEILARLQQGEKASDE